MSRLHLSAKEGGPVVMTVDLDLYLWLQREGAPSINFNHLRGWSLGLA
jgi:hypothetical protein